MTLEELQEITNQIDVEILVAKASDNAINFGVPGPEEGIYQEMQRLGAGWTSLRGPVLIGSDLIIVMIRPEQESEKE